MCPTALSEKPRLRVTVICPEYPPFVQGGLGVHYHDLLEELRHVCEVTLIAARVSRHTPAQESSDGLTIHRLLIPRFFPLNHIFFNIKAWFATRRTRPQVVDLCAPFGIFNLVFKKYPTVIKVHSLYKGQTGGFFYKRLVFPIAAQFDRFMINRADLVMTTSGFMKDDIMRQYKSERVVSVSNGLSPDWLSGDRDKKAARAQIDIPQDRIVILNVGRLVPRKGTLKLVEAFRELHERSPQAHLLLIGGSYTESANYEKRIIDYISENHLEDAVTMIGWMPVDQIKKYYDAADIYVHAATYEPFGNVILEAMARALPVVAVRSGGPEEIAGDSAMILETDDPGEMAREIEALVRDPELAARYARLSLARAKMFSWKRAANETGEYLRDMASS